MAAVLDSFAVGSNGGSGSSLSWNHTILAPVTHIFVCAEGEDTSGGSSNQNITGITFNGVAMTQVDQDSNTAAHSCSVALYELHGASVPVPGTYTVTVTYSASCESRAAGSMAFKGTKNQGFEAKNKANANGTSPFGASVTPLTKNALVVVAYGNQNAVGNPVFSTGETTVFNEQPASGETSLCTGAYKIVAVPALTATTFTVTNPEAEAVVIGVFEIEDGGLLLGAEI